MTHGAALLESPPAVVLGKLGLLDGGCRVLGSATASCEELVPERSAARSRPCSQQAASVGSTKTSVGVQAWT